MIENSNLLPRQKNRLLSIEEGKTRQLLVDNTSQGVKFGIDLAQAYRDFCQARNDYLKAEEELEKFKSSNTQKVKKLDQNYAKLEYEMQEALVDKLAEFEKSKIKLNYLRKSINIDYHEGKIAKKAEEIQKSEINQTKIEYLVKWFLAQNRERPIPREDLALAQEKYQVFAEIDQHVENMKDFSFFKKI